MIDGKNVLLKQGVTADDAFDLLKNYTDIVRASKTVGFAVVYGTNNLFTQMTENGQLLEVPLPSSLNTSLANGLISIDNNGIRLAPNNTYLFHFILRTTCNHDMIAEVGYRYYQNGVTDGTLHNSNRAILHALRNDDGSIYVPSPAVLTKNNVCTVFDTTFTVSGSEYPWENAVVPYIKAEFPGFDGTSSTRLTMNSWNLRITAYPRWSQ